MAQLLLEQLDKKKESPREMSLNAGLNHGAVSAILNGSRPNASTCSKLALYLNLPEAWLLWLAGWMQTPPDMNDFARTLSGMLEGLTRPEQVQVIEQVALWKKQRGKR